MIKRKTKEMVVITGAGGGIGSALVKKYVAEGAFVAALDLKTETLSLLVDSLGEGASLIKTYVVDVSNEAHMISVGQKILADIGKPTVWINNAGIVVLGDFEKVSSESFSKVMAVNFNGVVFGTRVALSLMKDPMRGKVVNMSSVSGSVPAAFMTSYTAAKHAVVGFTRSLREEMEQTQSAIQIMMVSPGFVRTGIMGAQAGFEFPRWLQWLVHDPESTAKEIVEGIATGRAEIMTSLHGRAIMTVHRMAPGIAARGSRLMAAKNWKELLRLVPIRR